MKTTGFTEFIIENHPDPDALLKDVSIFNQMCKLAELYCKNKLNHGK